MLKKILLFVVLVFIVAFAAGCGGNQETEKKVLKVGLEGTYPPFNFEKGNRVAMMLS